jgi:hypothetical protein
VDLYQLENGAREPEVENYFKDEIFHKSVASGGVKRIDRQPMAKHTVPDAAVPDTGAKLKVSTPVPCQTCFSDTTAVRHSLSNKPNLCPWELSQ